MSIYSEPPKARTFKEDNATLLVCWWCTIFAIFIILFRIFGRFIRSEKLFREDWIAFACIIPILCRMAFVHAVLYFGTNNAALLPSITESEILRRSMGSKFVLLSRLFYAATLWSLKLTVSEFFKRLIRNVSTSVHDLMLKGIRWFLLATFITVVIANLAECGKFQGYWQVIPDPGPRCRQGYAHLLTMGIVNIFTDLLLVFFPTSIILMSKMGLKKKFQLILLFSLSLLPAAVSLYRIPHVIDHQGSQQYRSILASVEILLATIAANALVLGSFVRDRGVKKTKFKIAYAGEIVEPIESQRGKLTQYWGSDEDLVRDLGLGVYSSPQPPQPAAAAAIPVEIPAENLFPVHWSLPEERRKFSDELCLIKMERHQRSRSDSVFVQSRKASFADIGEPFRGKHMRRLSQRSFVPVDEVSSSDQFA